MNSSLSNRDSRYLSCDDCSEADYKRWARQRRSEREYRDREGPSKACKRNEWQHRTKSPYCLKVDHFRKWRMINEKWGQEKFLCMRSELFVKKVYSIMNNAMNSSLV